MSSVNDKVSLLRQEAPELFDELRLDDSFLDEFIIVNSDVEQDYREGDYEEASAYNPPNFDVSKTSGPSKARLPKDWGNRREGVPKPPDAIGFYIPFHYLPTSWGIYLIVEELDKLTSFIHQQAPLATRDQSRKAAMLFVYYHEAYHHKIEMLGTRIELLSRKACYKTDVESLYREGQQSDKCIEETAANVHGLSKARHLLATKYKFSVAVRRQLDNALLKYMRLMPSKSYSSAADYFSPLNERKGVNEDWQRMEYWFFDQIQKRHLGGANWNVDVWSFGAFLDYPDNKVNGKVNYLYPTRGYPIPLGGRLLSTRQVIKKIEKKLGERLTFIRPANGSHKIYATRAGHEVTIPQNSNMPTGTLKSILNALGLNISVYEFLRQ